MDSVTFWSFKKYKKSGLNVNDLLDAEIKYTTDGDNDSEFFRLPSLFKNKEEIEQKNINYGYLATEEAAAQNRLENVNLMKKSLLGLSTLLNGDNNNNELGLTDYLDSIGSSFNKSRNMNRKTNVKLSDSIVGTQIEISENENKKPQNGKISRKKRVSSFMDIKEIAARLKPLSNDKVSSRTKLKPLVIDNNENLRENDDTNEQNKIYPWVNLEKYLNTKVPENPPNTPVPFAAAN